MEDQTEKFLDLANRLSNCNVISIEWQDAEERWEELSVKAARGLVSKKEIEEFEKLVEAAEAACKPKEE